jgi:hypothetical protein
MLGAENFRIEDPSLGVPIDEIVPISKKTWALLARHQSSPPLKTGFLNVYGAVDMIDGLEHHHSHFMVLVDRLCTVPAFTNESKAVERQLRHEVVAYLNRMGQFYHFTKSKFVARHITDATRLIPTILKFKPFRDKYAAHRSIDLPRPEDSADAQQLQAWGLSSVSGLLFSPKEKAKAASVLEELHDQLLSNVQLYNSKTRWKECYFGLQMRVTAKNEFVDFFLEKEHPIISQEAFRLIEILLTQQGQERAGMKCYTPAL